MNYEDEGGLGIIKFQYRKRYKGACNDFSSEGQSKEK